MLVSYAREALGDQVVDGWEPAELGDRIHELYLAASRRCRYIRAYADVLDSESEWRLLVRGLVGVRVLGEAAAPVPTTTPAAPQGRWWTY